jgi:hypothetical protein
MNIKSPKLQHLKECHLDEKPCLTLSFQASGRHGNNTKPKNTFSTQAFNDNELPTKTMKQLKHFPIVSLRSTKDMLRFVLPFCLFAYVRPVFVLFPIMKPFVFLSYGVMALCYFLNTTFIRLPPSTISSDFSRDEVSKEAMNATITTATTSSHSSNSSKEFRGYRRYDGSLNGSRYGIQNYAKLTKCYVDIS